LLLKLATGNNGSGSGIIAILLGLSIFTVDETVSFEVSITERVCIPKSLLFATYTFFPSWFTASPIGLPPTISIVAIIVLFEVSIAETKRSPVEWGFRYLWDYPEINVVLSGMSDINQVQNNIKLAEKGLSNSLTEAEKKLISRVKEIYRLKTRVYCTGCHYCMPCPSGVNIPESFKYLNNAEMFDRKEEEKILYSGLEGKASNCTECGECEDKCPQKTPIKEMLKEVVKLFEK